ncbi:carboxypeptidase-like regulatory domain-containing protein [Pontibacter sp. MBLB2868]|uniref:carboxypeptidase-like regulatory domain-containing protein n=1 Tax=Pontibacter sp. MBLB2868 TaxID=3451555 RepID=UPI003F753719
MRHVLKVVASFVLLLTISSCSKEDIGVQTVLKGHVSDNIRGINIEGYKIELIKSWRSCENFMCGLNSEEVATTYTDENGDYSITFNYKLKEGERYTLSEQYYGSPYYPEYSNQIEIVSGETNTVDINAWKPVELRLNVAVLNNISPPLMIRNEIDDSNTAFLNTENIYEQDITKTYTLRSKPNTAIKIIFWYYTGDNPFRTLHQKTFVHHTSLDDVNILSYMIDCSTF